MDNEHVNNGEANGKTTNCSEYACVNNPGQNKVSVIDKHIATPIGAWLLVFAVILVFGMLMLGVGLGGLFISPYELVRTYGGLTCAFLLVVLFPARLHNYLIFREYKSNGIKAIQRALSDTVIYGMLSCLIIDTLGKIMVNLIFGYPASREVWKGWCFLSPNLISLSNFRHVVPGLTEENIWNMNYLTQVFPNSIFSWFFLGFLLLALLLLFTRRRLKISTSAQFAIGLYIGGCFSEAAEVMVTGHHVTDWLFIGRTLYIDMADVTQPYAAGFLLLWIIHYPFRRWIQRPKEMEP